MEAAARSEHDGHLVSEVEGIYRLPLLLQWTPFCFKLYPSTSQHLDSQRKYAGEDRTQLAEDAGGQSRVEWNESASPLGVLDVEALLSQSALILKAAFDSHLLSSLPTRRCGRSTEEKGEGRRGKRREKREERRAKSRERHRERESQERDTKPTQLCPPSLILVQARVQVCDKPEEERVESAGARTTDYF